MGWFDSEHNRSTFFQLLSPSANDRILDVGAGKGTIAEAVQQASGSEVHALDPNVKRIQFIQEHYPKLKPCLSASDAIPYADAFFDKVYSTAAVHHFPDQQKSFMELARVLRPGGLLVIVEISPGTFAGRMARLFENGILRSHLRFLDPKELEEMLRRSYFCIGAIERNESVYFVRAVRIAASPANAQ